MSTTSYTSSGIVFGRDLWHVQKKNRALGLKLLYVVESLYIVTVSLSKVSVLLFFRRTFSQRWFQTATNTVLCLTIVTNLALLITQIIQCIPMKANWELDSPRYGHPNCINLQVFVVVGGVINILQELVLLAMPIPIVLRLPFQTRQQKTNSLIMFSLGVFTIACSIIRMVYVIRVEGAANFSWEYVDSIIWTNIEAGVTVMVPCLPTMRALILARKRAVNGQRELSGKWNFVRTV
ncbi:hypothetical protein B0T21DRAFT_283258 [Apiosordaria backusii]|uniref:Rhodopsin domain-containing protein n=1 Tax=Apiosordaria backusii TaxID=314023 RepID=A0AA40EM67_9PEZI|nr:hypothetical protein B0T21DRAFT_283258 [Apiosordaria backusii]